MNAITAACHDAPFTRDQVAALAATPHGAALLTDHLNALHGIRLDATPAGGMPDRGWPFDLWQQHEIDLFDAVVTAMKKKSSRGRLGISWSAQITPDHKAWDLFVISRDPATVYPPDSIGLGGDLNTGEIRNLARGYADNGEGGRLVTDTVPALCDALDDTRARLRYYADPAGDTE